MVLRLNMFRLQVMVSVLKDSNRVKLILLDGRTDSSLLSA